MLQNGVIAMLIAHDVARKVGRYEGFDRDDLPIIVGNRFNLDVDAEVLIICWRKRRPCQIIV